jgi:phosphatidate cytidylyltransferase
MTRVLSAAVLAALILAAIWLLPPWTVAALAAVVAAAAAAELAHLGARVAGPMPAVLPAVAAAAIAVAFAVEPSGAAGDSLRLLLLALIVAAGAASLAFGPPGPATLTRAGLLVMAPLYVGVPLGAIARIQSTLGPAATTWLLATIVVSDSAQYYTGRSLGRRKLAPALSPGKTVEGAIGGLVAAIVFGAIVGPRAIAGLVVWEAALLALLLTAAGMVGDLFESSLKRSAGEKDSSHLIPGHGGVLDRIDAHLFAAPVFYLVLRYFA